MKCFVTPSRLKESQHSQNVITKKKMKLYDCSKIHLYLISNCFEKKHNNIQYRFKIVVKKPESFSVKSL